MFLNRVGPLVSYILRNIFSFNNLMFIKIRIVNLGGRRTLLCKYKTVEAENKFHVVPLCFQ